MASVFQLYTAICFVLCVCDIAPDMPLPTWERELMAYVQRCVAYEDENEKISKGDLKDKIQLADAVRSKRHLDDMDFVEKVLRQPNVCEEDVLKRYIEHIEKYKLDEPTLFMYFAEEKCAKRIASHFDSNFVERHDFGFIFYIDKRNRFQVEYVLSVLERCWSTKRAGDLYEMNDCTCDFIEHVLSYCSLNQDQFSLDFMRRLQSLYLKWRDVSPERADFVYFLALRVSYEPTLINGWFNGLQDDRLNVLSAYALKCIFEFKEVYQLKIGVADAKKYIEMIDSAILSKNVSDSASASLQGIKEKLNDWISSGGE